MLPGSCLPTAQMLPANDVVQDWSVIVQARLTCCPGAPEFLLCDSAQMLPARKNIWFNA
jgi:hypothetical protein